MKGGGWRVGILEAVLSAVRVILLAPMCSTDALTAEQVQASELDPESLPLAVATRFPWPFPSARDMVSSCPGSTMR